MSDCSSFHPRFHKRAISFSFRLMNLIAVCQFCKLGRCLQLEEAIKGKAGGPATGWAHHGRWCWKPLQPECIKGWLLPQGWGARTKGDPWTGPSLRHSHEISPGSRWRIMSGAAGNWARDKAGDTATTWSKVHAGDRTGDELQCMC